MFEKQWKIQWCCVLMRAKKRKKTHRLCEFPTAKTSEQKTKKKNKLKTNMVSNKIISRKAPHRFDEVHQFAFADGLTLSWAAQQLRTLWDNCTLRQRSTPLQTMGQLMACLPDCGLFQTPYIFLEKTASDLTCISGNMGNIPPHTPNMLC